MQVNVTSDSLPELGYEANKLSTWLFSILTLLPLVSLLHWVPYSRELAWKKLCKEVVNMIFCGENFRGLLAGAANRGHAPNFL